MEDNNNNQQKHKEEPMTGTQHVALKDLAEKTGSKVAEDLTKDEAVKKIEALEIKKEQNENE